MPRIGLALSGGGFRATLFHLGMIRFMREAGILPSVTHITSVSGGSILAAHLVLNWDRYNDSLAEFDAAAAELIRLVQLDVRNRVVRRYPLAMPLRALQRLAFRRPDRQLTRTGLLERHYEKYLYGDTCLFQLPDRPRLYILATNLSEGCLCAFTRDGLLMQRRRPGNRFEFDLIHAGLATVPMAVTASSAFPGFFPPLELRGEDVGADPGKFNRLFFTDGGVYDNLGVRMFRHLERYLLAREIKVRRDDFADADHVARALDAAAQSQEDTPLRRLAQMMDLPPSTAKLTDQSGEERLNGLLQSLWDVMNYVNLAREPTFARLSSPDSDVDLALDAARKANGSIDPGEQMRVNRQLVEAAFQQTTGEPCFRTPNAFFDSVLVSDAGRPFKVTGDARASGLVATSMRATDIVMNRVWQLETDVFSGAPGFVFAPISKIVEPEEDPTADHPEVQRMAAGIRTDLDRFSPLEIRTLVRHGYCVGRSACRACPGLFGTIPTNAPWDPLSPPDARSLRPVRVELFPNVDGQNLGPKFGPVESRALMTSALPPEPATAETHISIESVRMAVPVPAPETVQSRRLQRSARRRLWSTLLDYRDWVSYLYVPLLIPILIILPYFGMKWHHEAQVAQQLIESVAQGNRDFAVMGKLLNEGPVAPFVGMQTQEVQEVMPLDYSGFEVISDARVYDYRSWQVAAVGATDDQSWGYVYRRMRVRKLTPSANEFVMRFRNQTLGIEARPLNKQIPTTLRLHRDAKAEDGTSFNILDVAFDLTFVAVGETVDLPVEIMIREPPPERLQAIALFVDAETEMFTIWLLMPAGRQFESTDVVRYAVGKAASPEPIVPANELTSEDGRILSFTLLSLKPGFRYEFRWTFRE
jgi:predicted acylesterase/phospholipase RssA